MGNIHTMKKFTYLFIILLSVMSLLNSNQLLAQDRTSNSSHVIVKIEGLTLEQYNAIATAYLKNPDVEIPYYCLDAGVIAMHYKHGGLSNADVQVSVITEIKRIIKHSNIRILDVETHSADDDSRC